MKRTTSPFLTSAGIPDAVGIQAARLCHFGFMLLNKHQFALALERFDTVLQEEVDCAAAYWGRALALQGLGNIELAFSVLCRAEALVQQPNQRLLQLRVELLMALRKYTLAAEACQVLIDLNSGSLTAQWLRLKLLWLNGFVVPGQLLEQSRLRVVSGQESDFMGEVMPLEACGAIAVPANVN